MMLGVHCSVAGGVSNAFKEVQELGIDTFQIFTKNQRQWKEKEIGGEEGKDFKDLMKSHDTKIVFSHATYLINLASPDPQLQERSILALAGEIMRCHALGLKYTVLHPGSAKDVGMQEAILRIAKAIDLVFEHTSMTEVNVLLENTAGQGNAIGYRFEQIGDIIEQVAHADRIGTCLDTCHAFAAGYDLRTKEGCESMVYELDKYIGLHKLKAIHLNDSKGALGSRIDRHEHIGKGHLGILPFQFMMRNFLHVPKVLETPKENDMDMVNLEILRSLV